MELAVWNVLLAVLVLLVVPIFVGNEICGVLKQEVTITKSFLMGTVGMWGICQIVAVPCVLLKQSFMVVAVVLSVLYGLLMADGMVHRRFVKISIAIDADTKQKKICSRIAAVIMFLAAAFLVLTSIFLQHTDADDSRFVVNAVDIYRTNRLLLTDVNTGHFISTWIGDLNKDVTSPWAVYMAFISKMTGIYPSIMMHTVYPPVLMLCACAVYWLFAKEFFQKDVMHQCMFVCFVILLDIYGYHSIYTSETFLLTRVWQGKAVVAGVGIPLVLYECMQLYKENKKSNLLMIAMTDFALCLMSNMGVIIGAALMGCFGLVYGIAKRDWKLWLCMWLCCIPNVLYLGISYMM